MNKKNIKKKISTNIFFIFFIFLFFYFFLFFLCLELDVAFNPIELRTFVANLG